MNMPPNSKGKRLIKVNAISQAQLIKLLLEGQHSCEELAELSGLHYVTVLQYCRELYRVEAAHICRWDKDKRGRDLIKIYRLGVGKDAKRQRMTGAQRQAACRARRKRQAAHLETLHVPLKMGRVGEVQEISAPAVELV